MPTTLSYLRPLFVEAQHFRQRWLWVLVMSVAVVLLGLSITMMLTMRAFPMTAAATLVAVPVALMVGLLAGARLTVIVDVDGVHIRFFPLRRLTIPHRRIVGVESVTYEPIGEFGGWGIKGPPGRWGWCYTVSGNRGVRIELDNRHRLLIGSQRPEELAEAILAARS
jgi:hypothetical protein